MQKIALGHNKFALVDDKDFAYLSQFKWHLQGRYVSRHNGFGKTPISMHRHLLGYGAGKQCDHIDGNGLNNQRDNLRVCDPVENYRNRRISANNTSGFKGVSWHKRIGKWISTIKVDDKSKHLGYFHSKEDAALAYDVAAKELFGEFSNLNFK